MSTLSDKDRELIVLLRADARAPVSALARKLGVSRTTVQDRLKRLEQSGAIAGYSVKLRDEIDRGGLRSLVFVEVEPRRSAAVIQSLKALARVEALHSVSGKFDLIAEVRSASAREMDLVLDDIGATPGVTRTESAIVLSTKFSR